MTFAFVAVFLAMSAALFSLMQVRTLRRTHGALCRERDEGWAWAGRLLTWGLAMSIAAVALLPGASAPETVVALLALDVPLVAGMVVLRRMQQTMPHERIPATASAEPLPN